MGFGACGAWGWGVSLWFRTFPWASVSRDGRFSCPPPPPAPSLPFPPLAFPCAEDRECQAWECPKAAQAQRPGSNQMDDRGVASLGRLAGFALLCSLIFRIKSHFFFKVQSYIYRV